MAGVSLQRAEGEGGGSYNTSIGKYCMGREEEERKGEGGDKGRYVTALVSRGVRHSKSFLW